MLAGLCQAGIELHKNAIFLDQMGYSSQVMHEEESRIVFNICRKAKEQQKLMLIRRTSNIRIIQTFPKFCLIIKSANLYYFAA